MPVKILTTDEVGHFYDEDREFYVDVVLPFVNKVTGRGDAVCFYRNEELGHPELGHMTVTSWGSPAAQLEATRFPEPPATLPDIGGAINWRYQLAGVIPGRPDSPFQVVARLSVEVD